MRASKLSPSALGLLLVCAVSGALVAAACSSDDGGGAAVDPANPGDAGPGGDGDGGTPEPVVAEFGLDTRPANPTCKAPPRPPPPGGAQLVRVWDTLTTTRPMGLAQPPGDKSRFFMANRSGVFFTFPAQNPTGVPTQVASVPALSGKPVLEDFEGGFLGFAFHPSWKQNGRIYVTFTTSGDGGGLASEVGYITSTDDGASFTSYTRVLAFARPKLEHNGGGIAFGPDGYLYLSFGDGALDGTYGQVKDGFFGKVLRIDVDDVPAGKTYGIPPTNPFANGGGEPATYAWGFRNPYRISIDRATGEVWLGDVGDNQYEEVNRVVLGGNYGWPCREGFHDTPYTTNPQKCPSKAGLIDPLVEHEHVTPNSRSITGGIVYRGSAIPGFQGTYVYSDFIQLELRALTFDPVTLEAKSEILNANGPQAGFSSFHEDADGEIYALALFQDSIFKLVPTDTGPQASTFPETLSKTGCVDPADPKKPAPGLIPYGVNAQLWSDGADKERWFAIPDGATIGATPEGDLDLPIGSVVVKTFSLGGKRVETRLLVRHDDGEWAGYSYEWNDEQTDAFLLPGGKSKVVGQQTWSFPSRIDCVRCHTQAAGRTLGLELPQLNGEHVYPSTNRRANQLRTLEHIGIFATPLGKPPAELPAYPKPTDEASPLDARARAYLHANCAGCHQPSGGAARSTMDLRYATPLAATKTCNEASAIDDDLGVAGAKLLVPGQPGLSLVSLRQHATGASKMPPLGRSLVDPMVSSVVDAWIEELSGCP